MNKESILLNQIRIKASRLGWVLFRNNVGFYKRDRRVVRYGLCVGSADLIGFRLHPNSYLQIAQFIAIEVKTPTGLVTKAQQHFIDTVNQHGGLGIIARCLEDVHE